MKIENFFLKNAEHLHTKAATKDEVLQDIAKIAVQSNTLKEIEPAYIYEKLKERETIGSTGFNQGIAIPHCSLDKISEFVIGVLIAPEGIDFQSIDGQKTKLFLFIIGPTNKRNQHINILSEISKVLKVKSNVDLLLSQNNTENFFNKFCELGNWDIEHKIPQEYAQITIHIQDHSVFDDVIEIFTEIQGCHISVIEANNVGKYLYALPLFSQFTHQESKGFHRVIIAVLNTVFVNNCIRNINETAKKSNAMSKILITSQTLSYFNGSISI